MNDKKSKRKKSQPLLYIHQPDFESPNIEMQDYFSSDSQIEETKSTDLDQISEVKKSPLPKKVNTDTKSGNPFLQNSVNPSQPISNVDYFRYHGKTDHQGYGLSPVKKFIDMTILEKIDYLLDMARSQPPFPCEFITNHKKIKGTLAKHEDGNIFIKTFKDEIIELPVSELQHIRIIM